MAKKVDNSVLDAALDEIATATSLTVCSAEPTDQSDVANVALADATVDGSDFTNADGDVSGRKVTVAQQSDIAIDSSGEATHVALDDGTDLLYVTTCDAQDLTSGGTVTVPSWDVEIEDPS